MDYMCDTLADGRKFRTLNIVDDFSRENPAIEVDTSRPGARVVRLLEWLHEVRGLPEEMVTDHGPQFTGQTLDKWAHWRGVKLHFIESERLYQELGWTRSVIQTPSLSAPGW
jgi:putative transposase